MIVITIIHYMCTHLKINSKPKPKFNPVHNTFYHQMSSEKQTEEQKEQKISHLRSVLEDCQNANKVLRKAYKENIMAHRSEMTSQRELIIRSRTDFIYMKSLFEAEVHKNNSAEKNQTFTGSPCERTENFFCSKTTIWTRKRTTSKTIKICFWTIFIVFCFWRRTWGSHHV